MNTRILGPVLILLVGMFVIAASNGRQADFDGTINR